MVPPVPLFLFFVYYAAASSFQPQCALPPPDTNYVSSPNTRGTISILWNCVSIFILCTWTIQRLNVPAARPAPSSTWRRIWWTVLDSRTKLAWMILAVLVPEYLLGKALSDWEAVKRRHAGMDSHARRAREEANAGNAAVEWTKLHARMANIGYFVLDLSDFDRDSWDRLQRSADEWAASSDRSTRINLSRLRHRCWALTENQWHRALDEDLADFPAAPATLLGDLNKTDVVATSLAVVQVLYLAVQLLARKVYGLPSTQIEIAALAFAATSLVTYVLSWDQPEGVRTTHVVKAKKLPKDGSTVHTVALWGPTYLWSGPRWEGRVDEQLDLVPIPNDGSHVDRNRMWGTPSAVISYLGWAGSRVLHLTAGALAGGIIFGGLHCLAWNFTFPTQVELLLWRICSILTGALPAFASLLLALWLPSLNDNSVRRSDGPHNNRRIEAALSACLVITLTCYVLARLYLLVEMFRTLFFLPPEAFVETWSGSFPHWQ